MRYARFVIPYSLVLGLIACLGACQMPDFQPISVGGKLEINPGIASPQAPENVDPENSGE